MKKISLLLFLLNSMFCVTVQSQTFTWGNPLSSSNESEATVQHYVSNSLYQVNVRYNSKIFNKDINVNSYDLSKLNTIKSIDLSIIQPPMGLTNNSNLELFQENGVNFVLFVDAFNPKTKERELYYSKVNIETGKKTDPVLITKMPSRNSTYFIVQSDNKQFYGVIKQYNVDKKLNDKLNVAVLDKDLKVAGEISYETPYINKNPYDQKFYVSNKGTIFIVKEIDLAKEKPFKTVFFWDKSKQTMTETSLKFDNDYQIHMYKGHFLNDDFYVHGLFTRIGSKGVQVYGGNKPTSGFLAAKFNTNGEKIYVEKNETEQIADVVMKDFVFDGLKTWFFGDNMFVAKKSKPVVAGQPYTFESDYTYKNDGFLFGKIDNETGKLEWFKKVPFSEADTTNDNGVFLSYLYFINNNQLTILYNDLQKTTLGKRVFNDRFIAIETYDDRGNKLSNSLIPDNGLEIEYESEYYGTLKENFDLDTSFSVFVQDGKYIVRAKSPRYEKYGYLKF